MPDKRGMAFLMKGRVLPRSCFAFHFKWRLNEKVGARLYETLIYFSIHFP